MAKAKSLPSRERGLKLHHSVAGGRRAGSLPSRERGLKLLIFCSFWCKLSSLPSRERGLKLDYAHKWLTVYSRSPRGSVD